MKGRPIPVIVVSILFILVGFVGFIYHIMEVSEPNNNLNETIWILSLRILAVVCGVLLLKKVEWARWLAIAWLAFHVIISAFNSMAETIAHIVFLILVSVLLFLPVSTAYFQNKNKQ